MIRFDFAAEGAGAPHLRLMAIAAALAMTGLAYGQTIDKNDNPGSLWSDAAPNPLKDRTARKVGDTVTIIITESSSASFSASTETSKNDANQVGQNLFIDFLDRIFKPWSTSASGSTSGEGTTTQSGRMTARVTAAVVEVLPNGLMLIEGRKALTTNRDTQIYRLSGVIRPDDVRPDNTVLSERIADAEVKLEGKGQIHDRQRRGILTRILDWLF